MYHIITTNIYPNHLSSIITGIHKLEPCPYRPLYGRIHILWANTGTFTSPHTGCPRVTGDTQRCSHMGHLNNFPNKRVHLCQTFKTRRNPCESGAGTNAAQNGNDIPMLVPFRVESPDGSFTMDASGGWGCGAFHRFEWFQLQWDITQPPAHHNKKLLPAIVMAVATYLGNKSGPASPPRQAVTTWQLSRFSGPTN